LAWGSSGIASRACITSLSVCPFRLSFAIFTFAFALAFGDLAGSLEPRCPPTTTWTSLRGTKSISSARYGL
jgi:hypothetical protein